jgi:hypothetical protein
VWVTRQPGRLPGACAHFDENSHGGLAIRRHGPHHEASLQPSHPASRPSRRRAPGNPQCPAGGRYREPATDRSFRRRLNGTLRYKIADQASWRARPGPMFITEREGAGRPSRCAGLLRRWWGRCAGLPEAEFIAVRVLAGREPAHVRDRHWLVCLSAEFVHTCRTCLDVVDREVRPRAAFTRAVRLPSAPLRRARLMGVCGCPTRA